MPNAKTKAETNTRTLRNPIEAARAHLRETYEKQHAKAQARVARLETELNTRDIALSKAIAAYEKAREDLADATLQLNEIENALELHDPIEDNE